MRNIGAFLFLTALPTALYAQRNRSWGDIRGVSRANYAGINESITWAPFSSDPYILDTRSEHRYQKDDRIAVHPGRPAWGGGTSWAGCTTCFGRVWRVKGTHYAKPAQGTPYDKKQDLIKNCVNGLCGTTIAYGCSLLHNSQPAPGGIASRQTVSSWRTVEVKTPNASIPAELSIATAPDESTREDRTVPTSTLLKPFRVPSNEMLTTAQVFERGRTLSETTQRQGMRSIVPLREMPGCKVMSSHPSGVPRIADGAFNGRVSYAQCEGFVAVISDDDLHAPTVSAVIVRQDFPADDGVINGGHRSVNYYRALDGRDEVNVDWLSVKAARTISIVLYPVTITPLQTTGAGYRILDALTATAPR